MLLSLHLRLSYMHLALTRDYSAVFWSAREDPISGGDVSSLESRGGEFGGGITVADGRICGCSEASRFAGLLLASSKGAQEVLLLGDAWSLAPARDGTLSLGFVLSSMARHLKLSHPSALFSSSTSVFVSFSPFLTDLNCAPVLRVGLLAMNPCVVVLFYGCVVSR
ncbi:hypothetical protein YC2023_023338 [Brassica napus]